MKNRTQIQVNTEIIGNAPISDEYFFKRLVYGMIFKMPFEELSRFIKFTKIDPNSPESVQKINSIETPEAERSNLIMLERNKVIIYEAEISL